MKNYTFLGRSNGRKFCIEGIDVFSNKWQTLGECDIVLEPETKKPYSFSIYRISTASKTITFAAGKFSDSTWGFYQPPEDEQDT